MSDHFNGLTDFAERCDALIKQGGSLLSQAYPGYSGSLRCGGENKPLTIAFAGQYSAGKSTILKGLTGIDGIETGPGITTEHAARYDWHGIEVVDTPGIGTGSRPEHDEISLKAIAEADLLVYVVTYALFDDTVAKEFRSLLIDRDKADEMILVVNKMADAPNGNTPEQREILGRDLAKVTEPYLPSQLRCTFIDAAAYLKSVLLADSNPERSARLRRSSNFDSFAGILDAFASERGFALRLTTPLYELQEALHSAVLVQGAENGDGDVNAIEGKLLRERHLVRQTIYGMQSTVREIAADAAAKIREEGRNLADGIDACSSNEEAEDLATKAYERVDAISEECNDRIVSNIESLGEKYRANLEGFRSFEFSRNLEIRLNDKQGVNPVVSRMLQPSLIAEGSEKIISYSIGDATEKGLKAFSSGGAHDLVLGIGRYFGHSFKPWEAAKWAKGINTAGKALGVFGVVLTLGLQAKDDFDVEADRRQRRRNRESIRASFNEAARSLESRYREACGRMLDESEGYRPRLALIDSQLDEIETRRSDKSELIRQLDCAAKECRALIKEAHENFSLGA